MHLRHIRPRSVDWYDATLEDGARGLEPLSPEEKSRLRQAEESQQQISVRAIEEGPLGARASIRFL
jgi:hypothetical protein